VAGLQVLGEGDDVILVRDVQDAALDTGLGAEQPCDLAGGVRHALVIAAGEQDQVVPVHTGRQPFYEGAAQSLIGARDEGADVLHLLAAVLAAGLVDEDAATEIGERLPVLHRRATAFATAHPELYALHPHRPTPTGAWLRRGGSDRPLLAAPDRDQLLAAVCEGQRGVATRVAFAPLVDGDVTRSPNAPPATRAVPTP